MPPYLSAALAFLLSGSKASKTELIRLRLIIAVANALHIQTCKKSSELALSKNCLIDPLSEHTLVSALGRGLKRATIASLLDDLHITKQTLLTVTSLEKIDGATRILLRAINNEALGVVAFAQLNRLMTFAKLHCGAEPESVNVIIPATQTDFDSCSTATDDDAAEPRVPADAASVVPPADSEPDSTLF
jgi:hypothetical protein